MKSTLRESVRRHKKKFSLDYTRVITRFFMPGGEERVRRIIQRVLKLSNDEVDDAYREIIDKFSDRHKDIWTVFDKHFKKVEYLVPKEVSLTKKKQSLIGAYFTQEYSIQAAAFFNPSIVPHPDQSGLKKGELRFIVSFRSTGEGHISSIEFRSGVIKANNRLRFDEVSRLVETPEITKNPKYDKPVFTRKLAEMESANEISEAILKTLPEFFTFTELEKSIGKYQRRDHSRALVHETIDNILWLARSNYEIRFRKKHSICERVIFPVSKNESSGIEDARFVCFTDDNGEVTYYATCTAYNGFSILPQLIVTKDFLKFRMVTLNGLYAKDKGMALFPRRIDGRYMMISRIDGENIYIMSSDNVHFWNEADMLQEPSDPWEFIQIGNCGSPIETPKGWLLLTHGVGPMRQYCIGAMLLKLEDPRHVIAKLQTPLLVASEEEREGYVPNVLYSCGSLIHRDELIIPYAMSDTASSIACVPVDDLLEELA